MHPKTGDYNFVSQMFFFHLSSQNLKLVAAFVVLVADFVVVVMWMVADFMVDFVVEMLA